MEWLGALVASGRIVDAILVLVAGEAALLALGPRMFGSRAPLLAGLAAGAGLMLAVRAALAEAAWPWIAAALTLALVGHLTEMCLRGREGLRRSADRETRAANLRSGSLRRREPAVTSRGTPALPAPGTLRVDADAESVRASAARQEVRVTPGHGTIAPDPGVAESRRAASLAEWPERARSTV